jgi:cyclopropane fatty-acyl-phospholipid synthase-like methyltransferase/DUF1365 family protein
VSWLYDVEIRHLRTDPVRHEVRHRSYQYYVDLDRLPVLPRPFAALARFDAADHLGDPRRSLRENVDTYLAEHGIDLGGGRITMLANARTLGHVFNPLTVYWCRDAAGSLAAVIAEVHNTYRGRHRYLLRPDYAGRAETEKQFYVSPFYPVDGSYRLHLPEPDERLSLTVSLHRPGETPFVATVRGVRRDATTRAVLATALRRPIETRRVRALITGHGIALWRAGLPVVPRPVDDVEENAMTAPENDAANGAKYGAADRIAQLYRDAVGAPLPVRVAAWDGSAAGPDGGPTLRIRRRRALRRLAWAPGELGLARAYVAGDVDVEGDLADGFRQVWRAARRSGSGAPRLSAAGRARLVVAAARLGALGLPPRPPASEARLQGRLHSRRRDRDAIAHHYDLSNDFYRLLLDETMAYSSAVFASAGVSLADAQRAKLDLICTKLGVRSGDRLLDVGCGWGSLILHAAERYGVRAVGVTLSGQQYDHVSKQIADRGLSELVTVRLQDYRELADELTGQFDAVSSVEMGEHVGEEQYPGYAAILYAALRPSGRLLLQQMSRRADAAPGGGAFIEAYIAPDMHMRPVSQTLAHLERAGFEIRDVQALREHYVTTVRHWIDRLEQDWDAFVALAGEEVARVWRLYLVGGALSFEEGRMGVDQILAVRTARDGTSAMPALR